MRNSGRSTSSSYWPGDDTVYSLRSSSSVDKISLVKSGSYLRSYIVSICLDDSRVDYTTMAVVAYIQSLLQNSRKTCEVYDTSDDWRSLLSAQYLKRRRTWFNKIEVKGVEDQYTWSITNIVGNGTAVMSFATLEGGASDRCWRTGQDREDETSPGPCIDR